MTDQRTTDRLIVHLRAHVAELRRLEREGAEQHELAERKRVIVRLHQQLAYAVRDLVSPRHPSTI